MNIELVVFATVVLAFITALIGVWAEVKKMRREGKETHNLINSRMDELLELTRSAARAEGVIEGRSEDLSL